ncbi:hypothetical protein [Acholeplasma laidlawii]|uniref:hypothetical protein n=1 Tax=Acholeplasma laidlawii TaxID=2148 RepID=UPI0021F7B9E8|nr:hypothetical protein [Acholeplasma laidlawii]
MSKLITDKNEIFNAIHKILEERSYFATNEDEFLDEDNIIGYTHIVLDNQYEVFDYIIDDKVLMVTNKVIIIIRVCNSFDINAIDRINSQVKKIFKPNVLIDYSLNPNGNCEKVEITVFLLNIGKNTNIMKKYN